jgi:eukaryotic-like serine/threonine-protein kinase
VVTSEAAVARPPKLAGKYTLLRELGSREVPTYAARFEPGSAEGGAGELVVLERYVTGDPGGEDDTLEKAVRDAEPLTDLAHPNLAGIRAVLVTGGAVLVASDFVEGETYADLTKSKDAEARLPFRARLRVMLDILAGLDALHGFVHGARKRVHGELAPDNVIVGVDGRARLVRVCNLFPERVSPASPTLGFIAPELVQGAAGMALVDARVDLYSAGVLLWEILTGKRLLVQTNSSALLLYELDQGPPRGIPAEDLPWAKDLVQVVKRALAVAADRWPSAAEMASAIAAAAEPETIAPAEEVAAFVLRVAREKIAARRVELERLAPRPATEAPPSIVKGGSRQPRTFTMPPPAVAAPAPIPVPAIEQPPPFVPAPFVPATPAPAPFVPVAPAPFVPVTQASAPFVPVTQAPAPAPAMVRDPDLSASIAFPLQRRRRPVVWAIAGGAAIVALVAIVHFATKSDPPPAASSAASASSATTARAPEIPTVPAPSASTQFELPQTTGSGPSAHKRRRPAPTPPSTMRKKFDPQGI